MVIIINKCFVVLADVMMNCAIQSQFKLALDYVGTEFVDKVNYYSRVWWPARTLIERAHSARFKVCFLIFTAQCTLVCLSVHLSVTLVICDHIGWKCSKLIVWAISPTPSLFVAKRQSTPSQGNVRKFWGD